MNMRNQRIRGGIGGEEEKKEVKGDVGLGHS